MTDTTLPDTTRIVSTVALYDGNLDTASEQLHMPPTQILLILSSDPEAQASLIKHMSAKLLLDSFTRMQTLSQLIDDDLASETSPFKPADKLDALKTYSEMFANLLRSRAQPGNDLGNVNIYERIISGLPPNVREAITLATPQTNGHTPDTTLEAHPAALRRVRARQDPEADLD